MAVWPPSAAVCMGPGETGNGCDHAPTMILVMTCGSVARLCTECHGDYEFQLARVTANGGHVHCAGIMGCRYQSPHELHLCETGSLSLN